jgi:adenosylmethionine-8-amino-7-oxononanoate aminotransferase
MQALHMNKKQTDLVEFDKKHVWHPYTSMSDPLPSYLVESAQGVHIKLATGEALVDGMSSWWSVLHGYNHPKLNQALVDQTQKMAHVMFGGLTHEPAINLCRKLIDITPEPLQKVFLSDSGSVSVEVAIKMSLQYWHSQGKGEKHKLLTVKNGYHGDTFAAMAVCDPVNGMHQIFESVLMKNIFAPAPQCDFYQTWDDNELIALESLFKVHNKEIAAFIIEPIVQGAGGMRFYHPSYLKACRELCTQYEVLFIADEIATGLGRTGKLFGCNWAEISPDIMCLGKTLTGGYMTLAATLCTEHIAQTISNGEAGCFMHGPTFMANPLACAVANASLELLETGEWQQQISFIECYLKENLLPLNNHSRVKNVRVLGGIGVVETISAVNMACIQKRFVELGVWIRPFGKLIYIMPPFISNAEDLEMLVKAITIVLDEEQCFVK